MPKLEDNNLIKNLKHSIIEIDAAAVNDLSYNSQQPSCLDSPSSIISPTKLNLSSSDKIDHFPVIRKLGYAETIYDYEHCSFKNVILIDSFDIESKINLYENVNLLKKAIFFWKQKNLLLRSSILTFDSLKDTIISADKYFVYADDNKVRSDENCKFFKMNFGNSNSTLTRNQIDQICHEMFAYECNVEFLDPKNDLLWRLNFIETTSQSNKGSNQPIYNYYVIFTAHHSIADARNSHFLLMQLFDIIDNTYSNIDAHYDCSNRFEPSIEERLFNSDPKILANINMSESANFNGNTCKVIKEFSTFNETIRKHHDGVDLTSISLESIDNNCKLINLIDVINDDKNVIKVYHMTLTDKFRKLLKLCKKHCTKLTACINTITALATRQLYKKFSCEKDLFNIHYHLLVNLRPFLQPPLDNFIMGYWAVVFGLNFDKECDLNDQTFWSEKFWEFVKSEANNLHEKLNNSEHFEAAKFDNILFEQINNGEKFPNGGGVHYALSNLGIMPASIQSSNKIKIKKHFFATTLQENRWSSVAFHGLTTIDSVLCWSITYNSKFFTNQIIDFLVENITQIIEKVTTT